MRRYSSVVPFWGIRVPKIEATARTINRGIVSRTEDRPAQREGKNPFSLSVDNGCLIKKLALSFGPTPARRIRIPVYLSFFMAFGTIGFGGLGKSLLAI